MQTTSLTIDVLNVVRDGRTSTEQAVTIIDSLRSELLRVGDSVQSISEAITERLPINILPTRDQVSTSRNLVLGTGSSTESITRPQNDYRGHDVQGTEGTLTSVQSTLSSRGRCTPSCMCQCHRGSQIGMPDLLTSILGSILISYHGIPYWRPRTCNHPRCQRKSPTQVRLNYMFPRWMLRKGIHVSLSWGSVTGSGVSLHLTVPRIICGDHLVWRAIASGNLSWLQSKVEANEIFLTDVDPDGESLLMVSIVIDSPHWTCLIGFLLDRR